MLIYLLIGLLVLAALWVVGTYNFFAGAKARIKAAVQEIGNQLKRQADLIPNLESSVKGYMKQEKSIFKDLTDARKAVMAAIKSGDVSKMADAGSRLSNILPSIRVAVEDNPELRSSEVVGKLMDELRDTADKIMYARRLVIDLTADYNVKRVTFPSSILAQMFGFQELPGIITPESGEHTEVKDSELSTPKIKL